MIGGSLASALDMRKHIWADAGFQKPGLRHFRAKQNPKP